VTRALARRQAFHRPRPPASMCGRSRTCTWARKTIWPGSGV